MSASTFLTKKSLWPKLMELAIECRQQKLVAAPYIGKDGAGPMRLRKGDVLICALTEANAKKGLVCPDEIAKLRRKGVKVYIEDHLHAKVYLIGRAAIVCSANLSQSSLNDLDEAGLLITDQKVTPSIREWFKERMGKEVTPEWLEHCLLSVSHRDGLLYSGYRPERLILYLWRIYYDRSNSVRSSQT